MPARQVRASGLAALLTPARLVRFGTAVAVALVAGFVVFLATADGIDAAAGGRVGGDFPAFYAAGELARTDPTALLDPDAQARAQEPYLQDGWAPFPYPPVLAFLFAPLSLLPFTAAYVTYVVLLLAAGFAAVRSTLDVLGVRDPSWRRVGMLGGMTFAPMLRSVGGAQNATITLLVLVLSARLLQRDRPVAAGLVAGLLWFKPQYAVPMVALLAVSGRWRAGLACLVPGMALWVANAAILGVGWTARWWDEIISVTNAGNKTFNTSLTVSPVEYLRGTLPEAHAEPVAVAVALGIGLVFALAVRRAPDPQTFLPLSCAALLLTALHALPYELVLLVPVLGLGLVRRGSDGVPAATAFHLLGWLVIVGPVHPVVRVLVLALAVLWMQVAPRHMPALPATPSRVGHG